MISSVMVSGVVGAMFLFVTVLGIRDLDAVVASHYPLPLIIEDNLGPYMAVAFFGLVAISIFACGLVIMASGSRMIYAMSRDNVFLGNRLFRQVSTSTSAPVPAIILVASLAMLAEVFLQEVDVGRSQSQRLDQPHLIARELEMDYHFRPACKSKRSNTATPFSVASRLSWST